MFLKTGNWWKHKTNKKCPIYLAIILYDICCNSTDISCFEDSGTFIDNGKGEFLIYFWESIVPTFWKIAWFIWKDITWMG
jgi:hypothetical protein